MGRLAGVDEARSYVIKLLVRLLGGWRIAATFTGLLVAWEILIWSTGIKPYILPAPSQVLVDLVKRREVVFNAMLFTMQPMLLGFGMAVIVGVGLSLLVVFSRTLQAVIYPLIVFLQIVPKIAVAPLFIIWFGYGLLPKVLLVFLLSFFPIVVSSVSAFDLSIPTSWIWRERPGPVPCASSGRSRSRMRCRPCSPASR